MEKCAVTLGNTGAWKAAASMVTKVANSRAMKLTQGLAVLFFIGASLGSHGDGMGESGSQLRLPVHAVDMRTAVDEEGIASHIAAVIAAEKDRHRTDILQGITNAPHGI